MDEIAATFRDAGLPSGFHAASAEVYRRLAGFKDAASPSLADVIETLTGHMDGSVDDVVDDQTKSTVITPRPA
jgi:enhancing lycopene biosynthesis protein 2